MKVVAVAVAALAVVIAPTLAPAADMAKGETINTDGAVIVKASFEQTTTGVLMCVVVGLPDTDGIELMEQVPGLTYLPVIFISAYGRGETIARAFESGTADYIVKPFSPTELTARVRRRCAAAPDPSPSCSASSSSTTSGDG